MFRNNGNESCGLVRCTFEKNDTCCIRDIEIITRGDSDDKR